MQTLVLGAGIIGISTAWHLLERGHEVVVVDRQPAAARETSFANAAQISVSYCEPWANKHAPAKLLKWMFRNDAPLLFRPQLDWHQWRWGLQFLSQCNDTAFERNLRQLVALGAYSHAALKDVVRATGIEYNRLERGIAHYFTDQASFEATAEAAELMQKVGVPRKGGEPRRAARDRAGVPVVRPPHRRRHLHRQRRERRRAAVHRATGAALRGARRDLPVRPRHRAAGKIGSSVEAVVVHDRATGTSRSLHAEAVIVAAGSWSAPLCAASASTCRSIPARGYSATFRLKQPERAPFVSTIDDEMKIAMTRLGDELRVAGTIEVGGYDLSLDSPLARARCRMLADRIEQVLPGFVCDTRSAEEGGNPRFWTGLRPATPTNIPVHWQDARRASCGSMPATARWAGPMAPAPARRSPSW
jgi:D-amino-acid dehydrogenase